MLGFMRKRNSVFLLVVLVVVTACSGSIKQRADTALSTALLATNAARDQFLAWDKAHQLELIAAAQTRAQGEAALAAYRAKREPVLHAFTVAYAAIGAAAALVPLVERGLRKDTELTGLIAEAATAIAAIREAVAAVRGSP